MLGSEIVKLIAKALIYCQSKDPGQLVHDARQNYSVLLEILPMLYVDPRKYFVLSKRQCYGRH